MANDTFFGELGTEPYGYVGQDTSENIFLKPQNCIHLFSSTVPILKLYIGIPEEEFIFKHKLYASNISPVSQLPVGIKAIHKLFASTPSADFIFVVHNSIHKQHFLDKWNATFHWDASRYLDTPYRFRLAETPVWDKCHDPSIIPGDPAVEQPGGIPGIGGMHNDLGGLQGGVPGEYYHLTLLERNKLAMMSQGSMTYVSQYKPDPKNSGDGWVNSETNILQMYYNTMFNDVSVEHSSTADEVDGGYF